MLKVMKRDGSLEAYRAAKIIRSVTRAGGTRKLGTLVSRRVRKKLGKKRTSSRTIRKHVLTVLRKENKRVARKYSTHKKKRKKVRNV